ncbi:MAG: flagellar motor protein MotA [Alphaproteobacteria bacterium]
MNGPRRYLGRMLAFLVTAAIVIGFLWTALEDAFLANPGLNGLILGVLVLGIIYIFQQVFQLSREVAWIENFRTGRPEVASHAKPRLLAPMATMLGERKGRFSLSAMAMRTLLDGISSRLDESRDISRYMIGLLIFLGLLGTFWGLLETIASIGDVISGLTAGGGDFGAVFSELKHGLKAPLAGMGTAFSSSLFGLAGSLVLGFLELQAGQAQNRFFNDLEDWLSGQTRLSSGALTGGEGDQSVPAYVQALLEQTADSLENLQRTLDRGEESRITANTGISSLTDKLGTLTDQMRTEQSLMIKLAESQLELRPVLAKIAAASDHFGGGFDENARGNIRNLDINMSRLMEELASGRAELVSELRSEIRVLSRTMAAIAEQAARPRNGAD